MYRFGTNCMNFVIESRYVAVAVEYGIGSRVVLMGFVQESLSHINI
jgi:hypothetical protein